MAKRLTTNKIFAATAASMLLVSATSLNALAANPTGTDYFGRNTQSSTVLRGNVGTQVQVPAVQQPMPFLPAAPVYNQSPITAQTTPAQWFKYMDMAIGTHQPSPMDHVILTRQFDKKVERVVEWTHTAERTARRYRELAQILRSTPVPPTINVQQKEEVGQLRTCLADWYDDSASIFEEYIRPRRPARTQEELNGQLNNLQSRSESLKLTMHNLFKMETHIRGRLNVGPPAREDAIMKYVNQPLKIH